MNRVRGVEYGRMWQRGHHGHSRTAKLPTGETLVLAAGLRDGVAIYRDGDELAVVESNSSFPYIGLERFNLDDKASAEDVEGGPSAIPGESVVFMQGSEQVDADFPKGLSEYSEAEVLTILMQWWS
jgi:hypothetical protein